MADNQQAARLEFLRRGWERMARTRFPAPFADPGPDDDVNECAWWYAEYRASAAIASACAKRGASWEEHAAQARRFKSMWEELKRSGKPTAS